MSDHRGERQPERRVHLSEAAELLGVSKDAVRMRVKRGTLRSEKGEDGRVHVWVNINPDGVPNGAHPKEQSEAWRELIDELRDRIRSLEDANRENRRIIATLTQHIPEIEAPAAPEAARMPHELQERSPALPIPRGAQEPSERPPDTAEWPMHGGLLRPWWRRVFGG